jgi:ribosomal protection tetracycline resistance protein
MPYAFFRAVEETVTRTLREWRVTDCAVTMTHSGYWAKQSSAHGVFDKSMSSTARDFRLLTPIVLGAALERAGTVALEPLASFRLECPPDTLAAVLGVLGRLGGAPSGGDEHALEGELPSAAVHALQLQLPALTRGEGVLETAFARYAEVRS